MAIRVSFSDTEKRDFTALPAGIYSVVVSDVEESEDVGPSGYPYLKWEFTIPEGEYENRRLWSNTSLAPKALFKLMELMEAFGEDPEALKHEDFEFEPSDYTGAELLVSVKIKTYEGELRNEIKNFYPTGYKPEVKKTTFSSAKSSAAPGKRSMKIR